MVLILVYPITRPYSCLLISDTTPSLLSTKLCHMAFSVIVVTFQLTLLMNKFNQMSYIEQVLVYFASKHVCNEMLSWMIEIWMENYLLSDIVAMCKSIMHNLIYKECK